MSNTSALREQSIEVIAMPNAMLQQCIGACCNKLWCKWDKISFQPEFSFQWSTKYLEKKKHLATGCIKASIKMYCVFLCLKKKKEKKVYKPKTSYVWMVLQKEKTKQNKSLSCSMEIFGNLGTFNRYFYCHDRTEMLGATARIWFASLSSVLFKKKGSSYVKARRETRAGHD